MSKRYIIFFDVWTKGTLHYKNLQLLFLNENIEIILLHFGSYGDEINNNLIRDINNITCYDMKFFNYDIKKAILKFNPIAILYLSIDPLIIRACNLYALKYKIKTYLTYPGLWSAQNFNKQRLLSNTSLLSYSKWLKSRISNYIKNYLPQYLKALLNSENKNKILLSFFKVEFSKLLGDLKPKESFDKNINIIFIYNYYDSLHAKKKFPNSSLKVIGVPDLYRFGKLKKFGKLYKIKEGHNEKFLYIGSGQRSRGMLINEPNKYYDYLLKVKNYFVKYDKEIIFKLHPSTIKSIEEINKKNNFQIKTVENESLHEILNGIDGCLTEPSSMSLIPIYLGLKLLATRMFELNQLEYGQSIKSYKLFSYINESNNLNKVLEKLNDIKESTIIKSINKISGPEPPEEFSVRIYQEIKNNIHK